MSAADPRVERIAQAIRVIPDFPKPGIKFQDITTLLLDHKAFQDCIDIFVERFKDKNITVVAGVEARGFIIGPPIALALGAKFVPLRKPKKLPGEVIFEEYVLEYGTDRLEMHVGAVETGDRALVIDDLIATGGTLCAAMNLLARPVLPLSGFSGWIGYYSRAAVCPGFAVASQEALPPLVFSAFFSCRAGPCCKSERAGAEVLECACIIELQGLKGRARLAGKPLFVLIEAE